MLGRVMSVYVSAIAVSRCAACAASRSGSSTTAMNAARLGNTLKRIWSH